MSSCGAIVVLIVVVLNLGLNFGETHSALVRGDGENEELNTSTISAEKRKEIEKLRAELNEAFEAHDEEQVANGAIVVQPKWLMDKEDKAQAKPTESQVEVTQQGLDEVKALRSEIQKAVENDVIVASFAGESKQEAKDLHQQLQAKQMGKEQLDTLITAKTPEDDNADLVGSLMEDELDFKAAGPNIVESNLHIEPDIDLRKLQRLEVSKRRTKETLLLKAIEEDFSFDLGEDVLAWAHITHAGEEFFIGQRIDDLLIVRKNSTKYEKNMNLHIGQRITSLVTYSTWNIEQQQQEGIIIVGTETKVLWYRVDPKTMRLERYWEWMIGLQISGLKYFKVESKTYLAITTNSSMASLINIYQFKLDSREFWIAQHLPLTTHCLDVAYLDTGRDLILALAQNHSAEIYSFNPNVPSFNHLYFQHLRSVPTEDIQSIAAFKMGGHSYLALGGRSPQILLYQQGDFISKTILGQNFGLVELFFPIPIRTYRDDLLLLVQHRVDFSTHTLPILETLIWNGAAFESTIPAPCHLGQQTVYGVSCMLDLQRDSGLQGAALLRRGDEVSIIVPRYKAESGLFRLHTQLLAKNSELLDLQDIFAFLKDWVKEQDDLIQQAESFLSMPDEVEPELAELDFSSLEMLKAPQVRLNGLYGQLFVNDYQWTEQDSNTDLEFVIEAIEQLEEELRESRPKRSISKHELIFDSLDFDTVEVGELRVRQVNNDDFYLQNGHLDFKGVLELSDLEIIEEDPSMRMESEAMHERMILEDIEVEQINGVVWSELMEQLVFRNEPVELEELELDGELIVEDELSIERLNAHRFPFDFLWSTGPSVSIVDAEKTFTETLSANAVDTEGLINGVNPTDAITLSDTQDWPGFPTFRQLEVTEAFELNGTAQGRGLRNFPRNPTLEAANIIQAACTFDDLEVNGAIFVKGQIDKGSLNKLLDNIIERPEDPAQEVHVEAQKIFDQLELPIDLQIDDAQVSQIPIEDFIPKHTSQEFLVSNIKGYVYFNNLTLEGTYDGVNVTDFLQKAIRINETQFSPQTQLNFANELNAKEIFIQNSLNGVGVAKGFQTLDEPLQLSKAKFEHLHAQTANIPNDIDGSSALLNGLQLEEFLARKSPTATSNTGNVFLDELVLEAPLTTDELHGIDAEVLLNFLADVDDLPSKILNGLVQVDRVVVTGNVQVDKLNDQHFDEHTQLTAIWLDRPNFLSTKLTFEQPLELQGDLNLLGELNGENLVELIDDLVFRKEAKEQTISILAPKSFRKDVLVRQQTKVDAINGVPLWAIANKKHNLTLQGNLELIGNLWVDELNVTENLNGFAMQNVSKLLRFVPEEQTFMLLGNITLTQPQYLQDLSVLGDMQQLSNLTQFFDNLLFKHQICRLSGKNTFAGRVSITKGAYIRSLNGYNLLALLSNMVFKNEPNVVHIRSPVTFSSKVQSHALTIEGRLGASNLSGCLLAEWLNDTLRVDETLNIESPLQFAPWSLDNNQLHVANLNTMNMSELLTLHTPQNLEELNFSELLLEDSIRTGGLVNGVDLQQAYENTLLRHGDQHVLTPLSMPGIVVLNDLVVNGLVNGDKNLSDLATLHEPDLTLESPLFFKDLTVSQLHTVADISGINLNEWYDKALWRQGRPEQHITGNWSVRQLNIKAEAEQPTMPLESYSYAGILRNPRAANNYKILCYKFKKIEEKLKRKHDQSKYIKKIEQRFELRMRAPSGSESRIRKTFVVGSGGNQTYILLNLGCNSQLYQWHTVNQTFSLFSEFTSGPIDSVFAVPPELRSKTQPPPTQFITSFESSEFQECAIDYLNMWPHLDLAQARSLHAKTIYKLQTINGSQLEQKLLNEEEAQLVVKQQHAISRAKRLSLNKYSLPLFYQRSSKAMLRSTIPQSSKNSTTNSTAPLSYSFADFRAVVANILSDLNYRLSLEINITQLSIPESDLFDAHLMQHFIAIMEELQQQQLYSREIFENITMATKQLPANPAQVLAANTVQIIWPVIVQIEEIHTNLQSNHSHEHHPVCMQLSNTLAWGIRDVLHLANFSRSDAEQNYTGELSAVIERIRKLQVDLNAIDLQVEESYIEVGAAQGVVPANLTQLDATLTLANAKESQSLIVGLPHNEHSLLAIIADMDALDRNAVHIFHDIENGPLLQSLKVENPHSLTTARLHNETLLAFIEQQRRVHVFIYRGIQGFIRLAKFKLPTEAKSLLYAPLPRPGKEGEQSKDLKHYLVAQHSKKLVFYEIVIGSGKQLKLSSIHCY